METSTRAISEELRRFLKYYEMTAINSLGGPSNQKINELSTSLQAIEKNSATDRSRRSLDDGHQSLAHPVPVMTPRDQSCERIDTTILKDEVISCFLIGGERRLCFPQILNTVLSDFDLLEINKSCAELNIHCSHCSKHQLEILKLTGVLPLTSANCNLITKSDAERLCNFLARQRQEQNRQRKNNSLLIGNSSTSSSLVDESKKASSSILVRHKCFGRCKGRYYPDKFTSLSSKCIQCEDCAEFLSPDRFVVHSHSKNQETRTCHWGFDSSNWRFYIHLPTDFEDVKEYQAILKEMKTRFKQQTATKRPAPVDDSLVAEKRPRLEPVKVLSQASPIIDRSLINNGTTPNTIQSNATANAVQLLLCDPLLTMAYYHLLANARFGAAAALPYVSSSTNLAPTQPSLPPHLVSVAATTSIAAAPPQVPLSVEEAAVALLKLSPQTCVVDKNSSSLHEIDSKTVKMKNDLYNFQHPEPFKKHLLNQFVHEQQQQQKIIKNETVVYRSSFESDDSSDLELLLTHFVKDPEGLRLISSKLSEVRRIHDEKLESLMAQNRILHQEIVYLRNRQNSSNVSSSIISP